MNILIITFGSRGDVQPYLALGKGLRTAGHDVTLCTAEQFEPLIRENGLNYGYMTGELLKLIDTDAGREALEETVGVFGSLKTMAKLARQTNPLNRQMILDSWAAAQQVEPQVVVYHPKALGGLSIAEAFNAQPFMALLQPMIVPTADFPAPGVPELPLGDRYNRISYKAVAMGMSMYAGMVNKIRQEEMGLDKFPRGTGLDKTAAGEPVPVLHAFSPHVVPRPDDWPPQAVIPGYWFLDSGQEWQPPAELENFLAAGDPPVYVGFGSMAGRDPVRLTGIVIDALRLAGLRGILATGWGGLQARDLHPTIFKLESAPHAWLFPRMAAVVHHGGAGTTAAGLRAARPTVICPFMGDQPFWGSRIHALGAGPEPIPQKKLTPENLAAALRHAVDGPEMRARAETVAEGIRSENGVANAIAIINKKAANP
ncbi:MAG: glycosyltransferase [Candidatus Promineifilaceae bacterium]